MIELLLPVAVGVAVALAVYFGLRKLLIRRDRA